MAQRVSGGEGGVLGGAVAVDEDVARGQASEVLADAGRRKDVTTGEDLADTGQRNGLGGNHLLKESGRQPERGDALADEQTAQLLE